MKTILARSMTYGDTGRILQGTGVEGPASIRSPSARPPPNARPQR
jgi:hypothetical protein